MNQNISYIGPFEDAEMGEARHFWEMTEFGVWSIFKNVFFMDNWMCLYASLLHSHCSPFLVLWIELRLHLSFSSLSDFFFCLIVPLFNKESILNVPVVAAFLTLDGGLCSSPPAGRLLIDVLRSIIAYWFCGCRDSLDPITTIEWVYIVITVLIACC